jgi:hypothetical protein
MSGPPTRLRTAAALGSLTTILFRWFAVNVSMTYMFPIESEFCDQSMVDAQLTVATGGYRAAHAGTGSLDGGLLT